MLASGDVLPHRSVVDRARAYGARSGRSYDFGPMFAAIRPLVSAADLAVCHLEELLVAGFSGRHGHLGNNCASGGGHDRRGVGVVVGVDPDGRARRCLPACASR